MREFEYDTEKSKSNLEKQGIDFELAQTIWLDPEAVEIPTKFTEEPRFVVIGKIKSKHWSAVITYRNEKIRIISVRRARENEAIFYENI